MRKRKLLQKALSNPQNLRFKEMMALVELFGFRLSRVKGSLTSLFIQTCRN
jgi:DNA-binding phage protein